MKRTPLLITKTVSMMIITQNDKTKSDVGKNSDDMRTVIITTTTTRIRKAQSYLALKCI